MSSDVASAARLRALEIARDPLTAEQAHTAR
jgi:hypothetical protein